MRKTIINPPLNLWLKTQPENCERFEPGIHFKSRLSLIVLVNVVLNMTVVDQTVTDVSTTCAVVIFRVKASCITSVDHVS